MSDSGFTKLPSGILDGLKNLPPGKGEEKVQVEKLPAPLRILNKAVRISGEVVQADSKTGHVEILTDEGETVEVRVGRNTPRPPAAKSGAGAGTANEYRATPPRRQSATAATAAGRQSKHGPKYKPEYKHISRHDPDPRA